MRGTRPAGYGFVTVKNRAVADEAIAALNDKELKERKVIVELAKKYVRKHFPSRSLLDCALAAIFSNMAGIAHRAPQDAVGAGSARIHSPAFVLLQLAHKPCS